MEKIFYHIGEKVQDDLEIQASTWTGALVPLAAPVVDIIAPDGQVAAAGIQSLDVDANADPKTHYYIEFTIPTSAATGAGWKMLWRWEDSDGARTEEHSFGIRPALKISPSWMLRVTAALAAPLVEKVLLDDAQLRYL